MERVQPVPADGHYRPSGAAGRSGGRHAGCGRRARTPRRNAGAVRLARPARAGVARGRRVRGPAGGRRVGRAGTEAARCGRAPAGNCRAAGPLPRGDGRRGGGTGGRDRRGGRPGAVWVRPPPAAVAAGPAAAPRAGRAAVRVPARAGPRQAARPADERRPAAGRGAALVQPAGARRAGAVPGRARAGVRRVGHARHRPGGPPGVRAGGAARGRDPVRRATQGQSRRAVRDGRRCRPRHRNDLGPFPPAKEDCDDRHVPGPSVRLARRGGARPAAARHLLVYAHRPPAGRPRGQGGVATVLARSRHRQPLMARAPHRRRTEHLWLNRRPPGPRPAPAARRPAPCTRP